MNLFYLCLSCVLFCVSCKDKPESVDSVHHAVEPGAKGEWKDELTYQNPHFGVEIQLLEGWYRDKEAVNYKEVVSKVAADASDDRVAAMTEAGERSHKVFMIFKNDPASERTGFNNNILMNIENLEQFNKSFTGESYLKEMLGNYEVMKLDITVLSPVKSTQLNGIECGQVSFIMKVKGTAIYQTCFAIEKGQRVMILAVSSGENDHSELVEKVTMGMKRLN